MQLCEEQIARDITEQERYNTAKKQNTGFSLHVKTAYSSFTVNIELQV